MEKGKNAMRLLTIATLAVLVFFIKDICLAAEPTEIAAGQVYQILVDTQIREKGETGAKKIADVPAGSVIMVTAYESGDWCEILHESQKGFIQIAALVPVGDVSALDQEFENIRNDYEKVYEEVLEIQKQKRTSRIWGGVIAAFVIAIFAVGIVSALPSKKQKGKGENSL